jgi:hypothetical protein
MLCLNSICISLLLQPSGFAHKYIPMLCSNSNFISLYSRDTLTHNSIPLLCSNSNFISDSQILFCCKDNKSLHISAKTSLGPYRTFVRLLNFCYTVLHRNSSSIVFIIGKSKNYFQETFGRKSNCRLMCTQIAFVDGPYCFPKCVALNPQESCHYFSPRGMEICVSLVELHLIHHSENMRKDGQWPISAVLHRTPLDVLTATLAHFSSL